jgi:putative hemolysin
MPLPTIVPLIALCLLLAGCQASSAPPNVTTVEREALDRAGPSAQRLPNPADEKCLRDGYQIKPILINGIPVDSECVNPSNGKTCRTWTYFRNECRL